MVLPNNPDLLDPRARAEAEARVSAFDAAVKRAETNLQAADQEQEHADTEYERIRRLREMGASSESALQDALFVMRAAREQQRSVGFSLDMARFELEQALLSGDLSVADLPAAWHAKYREYLGIESPTDADGVLQDVHWSIGAFGYFPTYSLGNLYAAQLFEAAQRDLGELAPMFRRGEFLQLRDWLRKNVHEHGRRYPAAELASRVTGEKLTHDALLRHLRGKFAPLYGLN